MDGTLIEQRLDFVAIRAELGVESSADIIQMLERMPSEDRRVASRRLEELELAAAEQSTLMPGAEDLLARIAAAGLKTALLTRTSLPAMATVLARHDLNFDLAWSRENGPIKPEPQGILRACRELGIEPARTCCVGDYLYDVVAANAAGSFSVLLNAGDAPFAGDARRVIARLSELAGILEI